VRNSETGALKDRVLNRVRWRSGREDDRLAVRSGVIHDNRRGMPNERLHAMGSDINTDNPGTFLPVIPQENDVPVVVQPTHILD
jgi:hypothetical protein